MGRTKKCHFIYFILFLKCYLKSMLELFETKNANNKLGKPNYRLPCNYLKEWSHSLYTDIGRGSKTLSGKQKQKRKKFQKICTVWYLLC